MRCLCSSGSVVDMRGPVTHMQSTHGILRLSATSPLNPTDAVTSVAPAKTACLDYAGFCELIYTMRTGTDTSCNDVPIHRFIIIIRQYILDNSTYAESCPRAYTLPNVQIPRRGATHYLVLQVGTRLRPWWLRPPSCSIMQQSALATTI